MIKKKLSRRQRREQQLSARRRRRLLRWSAVAGIVVLLVGGILAFNSCLDSGRHQPYVQQDLQAGFEFGARGTPSFFVNGQPANLFSYESAVATIRAELD